MPSIVFAPMWRREDIEVGCRVFGGRLLFLCLYSMVCMLY